MEDCNYKGKRVGTWPESQQKKFLKNILQLNKVRFSL